jgi:hypothetical protein
MGNDDVPLLKVGAAPRRPGRAAVAALTRRGGGAEGTRARPAAGAVDSQKETVGIVHGIDAPAWDPSADTAIAARYGSSDLTGKAACRRALADRAGWPSDPAESGHNWPIVGMIARLTDAQGMGLVIAALEKLAKLETAIVRARARRSRASRDAGRGRAPHARPRVRAAHVRRRARRARSSRARTRSSCPRSPSRTAARALRAMRYGAVPVAHRVGGLADAVTDYDPIAGTGTGFTFLSPTPDDLVAALAQACATVHEPHLWRRLVRNVDAARRHLAGDRGRLRGRLPGRAQAGRGAALRRVGHGDRARLIDARRRSGTSLFRFAEPFSSKVPAMKRLAALLLLGALAAPAAAQYCDTSNSCFFPPGPCAYLVNRGSSRSRTAGS